MKLHSYNTFLNEARETKATLLSNYLELTGFNQERMAKDPTFRPIYKSLTEIQAKNLKTLIAKYDSKDPETILHLLQANYYVPAIKISPISILTGKTRFGWSIYDTPAKMIRTDQNMWLYGVSHFEVGDLVTVIDNDKNVIYSGLGKVTQIIDSTYEDLRKFYTKMGFHIGKLGAYKKAPTDHLNEISSAYSIKGIASYDSLKNN